MKATYDARTDTLSIVLKPGSSVAESGEDKPGVILDYDEDGKPDLVNYDLRDGTYIIPKIMDSGYVELGKKRMDFARKG